MNIVSDKDKVHTIHPAGQMLYPIRKKGQSNEITAFSSLYAVADTIIIAWANAVRRELKSW
jgi:hypothetical protein